MLFFFGEGGMLPSTRALEFVLKFFRALWNVCVHTSTHAYTHTRYTQTHTRYAAVCGHIRSSMRTHTQQYADTYAVERGHICSSMKTHTQQHEDTYAAV